jgi:hypothetical protein
MFLLAYDSKKLKNKDAHRQGQKGKENQKGPRLAKRETNKQKKDRSWWFPCHTPKGLCTC